MWRAIFKDDTFLDEFDNGKERLFGEVLKRLNDLKSLSIIVGDKKYSVEMLNGFFSISSNKENSGFFVLDNEVYNEKTLENIRPIYFVRETVNFTLACTQVGPTKTNFVALGFQAIFKGKNIKRYLAIYPTGDFVIKDE